MTVLCAAVDLEPAPPVRRIVAVGEPARIDDERPSGGDLDVQRVVVAVAAVAKRAAVEDEEPLAVGRAVRPGRFAARSSRRWESSRSPAMACVPVPSARGDVQPVRAARRDRRRAQADRDSCRCRCPTAPESCRRGDAGASKSRRLEPAARRTRARIADRSAARSRARRETSAATTWW